MVRESYFIIPDYQFICGPLTEFDPNAILREVCTDLNTVLNYVWEYALTGHFPKLNRYALQGTFDFIGRELNSHGVLLEGERALEYVRATQEVAKAFVTAVSTEPYWFTRYGQWIGARYCAQKPGAVEFLVRYEEVKYPEYEEPALLQQLTPKIQTLTEMLLGNLAGKVL
jgi:hypothetical protein|nr:MAG TPA: protein of unknown function (DUF4719) [Caudoviricetes sp.]